MDAKPKIVILVGPAGSGKSTKAYTLEKGLGYVRISQDDQGKEHMELFKKALNEKKNIVIDRMNFDKNQRNRYLDPAKAAGYETKIIVFHLPFATCFERCMARENHPTIHNRGGRVSSRVDTSAYYVDDKQKSDSASSALNTFFKLYERVEDSEANEVERLGWDGRKAQCIYSDIDGTLADIEHRRHYTQKTVEYPKPHWGKFFAEMVNDKPNKFCVEIIRAMLAKASNMTPEERPYELVIATGRPDNYHQQTTEWLHQTFGYKNYSHLLMRPRNDFRKDSIVKEIMLEFEIKTRYDVLFALDDRDQVVEMLRKHGVRVLQVDYGDF